MVIYDDNNVKEIIPLKLQSPRQKFKFFFPFFMLPFNFLLFLLNLDLWTDFKSWLNQTSCDNKALHHNICTTESNQTPKSNIYTHSTRGHYIIQCYEFIRDPTKIEEKNEKGKKG